MPYKSERQRRYMHSKHPKIAKRWDEEHHSSKPKPKPKRRKK